jgi:hypothetical protein
VLADVLAGHSLDEVDDWLEGVEGLGREEPRRCGSTAG